MDVDFAFICDFADLSGQKINALGIGFDTIYASELPVIHPHFNLIAQIKASIAEAGDKDLVVRLIDADGQDVIPEITGTLNIPTPSEGSMEITARIDIKFDGVEFEKYSQYSLHIVIQGTEMIRIPIRVAPPPSTA